MIHRLDMGAHISSYQRVVLEFIAPPPPRLMGAAAYPTKAQSYKYDDIEGGLEDMSPRASPRVSVDDCAPCRRWAPMMMIAYLSA
jgi:hypothetical protein